MGACGSVAARVCRWHTHSHTHASEAGTHTHTCTRLLLARTSVLELQQLTAVNSRPGVKTAGIQDCKGTGRGAAAGGLRISIDMPKHGGVRDGAAEERDEDRKCKEAKETHRFVQRPYALLPVLVRVFAPSLFHTHKHGRSEVIYTIVDVAARGKQGKAPDNAFRGH